MIAVGVARPRSTRASYDQHSNKGQTKWRACEKPNWASTKQEPNYQTCKSNHTRTIGTKIAEILSANAWMGALLPWASPLWWFVRVMSLINLCCSKYKWSTGVYRTRNNTVINFSSVLASVLQSPLTHLQMIHLLWPIHRQESLIQVFTIMRSSCWTSFTEISTSLPSRITRCCFCLQIEVFNSITCLEFWTSFEVFPKGNKS